MIESFLRFLIGVPKQPTHIPHMSAQKAAQRQHALLKKESQIGSTLLGPVPSGHAREFFYLGRNIWVWDEQWFDATVAKRAHLHVQYEFQPRGVLKTVNGTAQGFVEGKELTNLLRAIRAYKQQVASQVYNRPMMAV